MAVSKLLYKLHSFKTNTWGGRDSTVVGAFALYAADSELTVV